MSGDGVSEITNSCAASGHVLDDLLSMYSGSRGFSCIAIPSSPGPGTVFFFSGDRATKRENDGGFIVDFDGISKIIGNQGDNLCDAFKSADDYKCRLTMFYRAPVFDSSDQVGASRLSTCFRGLFRVVSREIICWLFYMLLQCAPDQ